MPAALEPRTSVAARRRTNFGRRQLQLQRGRRPTERDIGSSGHRCRKRLLSTTAAPSPTCADFPCRHARQFPLIGSIVVLLHFTHAQRAIGTRASSQFAETGSKAGIQPDTQPSPKAVIRLGCGDLPSQYEWPGTYCNPLKCELAGPRAVRVSGNWRLTFAFEGRERDSRRLQGLPLGDRLCFPSIPPRRSFEGLSGRQDVKEAAKRLGVTRANLSRILKRPRRYFQR